MKPGVIVDDVVYCQYNGTSCSSIGGGCVRLWWWEIVYVDRCMVETVDIYNEWGVIVA